MKSKQTAVRGPIGGSRLPFTGFYWTLACNWVILEADLPTLMVWDANSQKILMALPLYLAVNHKALKLPNNSGRYEGVLRNLCSYQLNSSKLIYKGNGGNATPPPEDCRCPETPTARHWALVPAPLHWNIDCALRSLGKLNPQTQISKSILVVQHLRFSKYVTLILRFLFDAYFWNLQVWGPNLQVFLGFFSKPPDLHVMGVERSVVMLSFLKHKTVPKNIKFMPLTDNTIAKRKKNQGLIFLGMCLSE